MKKNITSCLLLASVVVLGQTVLAQQVMAMTEAQTEAKVYIKGGTLEFIDLSESAKIEFEEITLSGKIEEVEEGQTAATVSISDFRGGGGQWEVLVKEKNTGAPDQPSYAFTDQGLAITMTPEVLAGNAVSSQPVSITSFASLFATGGQWNSTLKINPTLTVPKAVTAGSHSTQLEWTLQPAV